VSTIFNTPPAEDHQVRWHLANVMPGCLKAAGHFAFDEAESTMDEIVRIPVTDILDLHSIPPRDVKPVVEEYLNEALRLGYTALRIIHGRGIGVQREIVRGVLAKTGFVRSFGDAPPDAGGWGATVITVVNPPDRAVSTGEWRGPLLRGDQKP
jgi:hypothetical protein